VKTNAKKSGGYDRNVLFNRMFYVNRMQKKSFIIINVSDIANNNDDFMTKTL